MGKVSDTGNMYEIDFDKVQSIEDIKRILIALDIRFSPSYPALNSIIDLIKLENNENTPA